MKNIRILFFVHCFFPDHFYGTETYTLNLSKQYRSLGHEVTIATAIFQRKHKKEKLINQYFWEGIPVIVIDKSVFPNLSIRDTYYQNEMYDVLEKILNKIKPDIVHITHLINHTSILLEVTGKLNIPTYATFTDFFGFCFNNKLESANGNLCNGPSVSRANCINCYLMGMIKNNFEINWLNRKIIPVVTNIISNSLVGMKKVHLLRNKYLKKIVEDITQRPDILSCLYNKYYKGAIAPTNFLKEVYKKNGIRIPINKLWFGVDIDRRPKPLRSKGYVPVIGYIGQIAPHKGIDIIIKAFKKLPKNMAILKIYGPINQFLNYAKEIKRLIDGEDNILLMGTFEQTLASNIFQEIDLSVIPSLWYENSPLVLLNSLATHTPVLISNVAGMTEFLNEGKNGYSFKRGDVNDLRDKLSYILQTPRLLSKLSLTTQYLRTTRIMAKETLSFY